MTKLQFLILKAGSQLWIRPTLLSLAAIGWVALAYFSDRMWPASWRVDISKDTLINLFSILASTMLTVATFSVSAVATAFSSVATSATPRATGIVMSDSRVQSTLAAFLAAFIYAVVSITSLSAVDFGAPGRFLLFLGFVLLVGWVLMSFLRWVDRVSRLGKLGDTLERVTEAARKAFSDPEISGLLGGRDQADEARPEDGTILHFDRFGYAQNLDMEGLQAIAEKLDARIWLDIRPGSLVTKRAPFGVFAGKKPLEAETLKKLLNCITVGADRSHENDPRFAMILFAEVADRALSPAVNDPGTAIAVLSVQLELLHTWAEHDLNRDAPAKFDRVFLPTITANDLVFDAFTPIARDGAGMIEVGMRLQKALRALLFIDHPGLQKAVRAFRETAWELAEQALPIESQRAVLREIVERPVPAPKKA